MVMGIRDLWLVMVPQWGHWTGAEAVVAFSSMSGASNNFPHWDSGRVIFLYT